MNRIDHIDLIHKQLSNDITPEEVTQLNEWLNLSIENKEEADLIKMVWEQTELTESGMELLAGEVDLDHEFSLLDERIKADEAAEETLVVPMRRRYWSIAAGFAVIIGLTTFLIWNNIGGAQLAEVTTGDEAKEILLADGSTVHLNAHSSLKYPETFDGDTREVELAGEAFFDIAKDPEHPFTVHTPYEDITVLGTSFNVRAFDNEPNSEVAVATGKVEVASKMGKVVLLPNQKAIVDHSSGVLGQEETESLNESAWHTGTIQFANTPVPAVLEDLEDFYSIDLSYNNPQLANCLFTSTFTNEDDLSTVLKTISTVLDVEISEKNNGEYVLVGGGCK